MRNVPGAAGSRLTSYTPFGSYTSSVEGVIVVSRRTRHRNGRNLFCWGAKAASWIRVTTTRDHCERTKYNNMVPVGPLDHRDRKVRPGRSTNHAWFASVPLVVRPALSQLPRTYPLQPNKRRLLRIGVVKVNQALASFCPSGAWPRIAGTAKRERDQPNRTRVGARIMAFDPLSHFGGASIASFSNRVRHPGSTRP
jgi:hypothetical protein